LVRDELMGREGGVLGGKRLERKGTWGITKNKKRAGKGQNPVIAHVKQSSHRNLPRKSKQEGENFAGEH